MTNIPLNSNDQGKIVIFAILLFPSIVFLFGIIPVILLYFGIYMRRKNQDFSSIDTAVKHFKFYYWLMLIGSIIFYIKTSYDFYYDCDSCQEIPLVDFIRQWPWVSVKYGISLFDNYSEEYFYFPLFFFAHAFTYLVAVNFLFYRPLKKHSEWVAVNGFFATKPKSVATDGAESEVDIIKAEKLKQYSVADELLKWAKLKEDGHISEAEFNEARDKLLKRN